MPISSMSTTWSISEKSVWFLLASSGFLLMVANEIGSLAHLTCFYRVALSSIFWSISKPLFPEFCVFFENMAFQFFMIFSNNFHHLSGCSTFDKGRRSKEPFLHTFLVYHVIILLNWYVVTQALPGNIVCFVVMLSLV